MSKRFHKAQGPSADNGVENKFGQLFKAIKKDKEDELMGKVKKELKSELLGLYLKANQRTLDLTRTLVKDNIKDG